MIYINTSERWNKMRLSSLFFENRIINSDFKVQRAFKFYFGSIVPKKEYELTNNLINTYKKYVIVKPGDIIINGLNLNYDFVTQRVGLAKELGIITSAYICLRSRSSINSKYYCYLFKTIDAHKMFHGLGSGIRLTLSFNDIKNFQIPVPPRSEQDQIVKFLDWKVSCINKLIHIKKKQIVLFREKLDAHISEVITHGINTSVEMKDSGIEWIKDIPKHWETIRCKFLFSERDERSEDGKEQHLSMSQKYGLIPDSQLDERRLLSESYKGGKLCYENDLVLNRLKAHLGVFSLSPQYGVISPDYTVLKPKSERILPSFAEIVLKSNKCRGELRTRVRGVVEGFWRLYTNDFNSIELPIPPIDEQKEIIANINFFKVNTKRCEDILIKEITLLNELKERVIADTVTGKIDVRDTIIPEHVCDDEYNIIYEDSKCEEENEDQNF